MEHKAPRLPRVERHETIVVHEDENQHLWAVSYADFLMALLSFFILFFSFDKPDQESLILNLAESFGGGKPVQMDSQQKEKLHSLRLPSSLDLKMGKLELEESTDQKSLTVNFPNNMFLPGQFKINDESQGLLVQFLEKLAPYQDKINLYFEGHADRAPLRLHKNDVVSDNFVLSSLRATNALAIAKQQGFQETNLFIQAVSSNRRNSRTISVRIETKKGIL